MDAVSTFFGHIAACTVGIYCCVAAPRSNKINAAARERQLVNVPEHNVNICPAHQQRGGAGNGGGNSKQLFHGHSLGCSRMK